MFDVQLKKAITMFQFLLPKVSLQPWKPPMSCKNTILLSPVENGKSAFSQFETIEVIFLKISDISTFIMSCNEGFGWRKFSSQKDRLSRFSKI